MRGRGADEWRVVVDDGDTGLWHTLDAYTDLTVARPALPLGVVPPSARHPAQLDRLAGWPTHDSGRLCWGELLLVADGVATAGPDWQLLRLGRTRRDPECYQVPVRDDRQAGA